MNTYSGKTENVNNYSIVRTMGHCRSGRIEVRTMSAITLRGTNRIIAAVN